MESGEANIYAVEPSGDVHQKHKRDNSARNPAYRNTADENVGLLFADFGHVNPPQLHHVGRRAPVYIKIYWASMVVRAERRLWRRQIKLGKVRLWPGCCLSGLMTEEMFVRTGPERSDGLPVSYGMDAPTLNGIDVPKWKCRATT